MTPALTRNGCEQDERAVSRTICAAPALAIERGESASPGGESALKQCRPAERISTVSTYHRSGKEGRRPYGKLSLQLFWWRNT